MASDNDETRRAIELSRQEALIKELHAAGVHLNEMALATNISTKTVERETLERYSDEASTNRQLARLALKESKIEADAEEKRFFELQMQQLAEQQQKEKEKEKKLIADQNPPEEDEETIEKRAIALSIALSGNPGAGDNAEEDEEEALTRAAIALSLGTPATDTPVVDPRQAQRDLFLSGRAVKNALSATNLKSNDGNKQKAKA